MDAIGVNLLLMSYIKKLDYVFFKKIFQKFQNISKFHNQLACPKNCAEANRMAASLCAHCDANKYISFIVVYFFQRYYSACFSCCHSAIITKPRCDKMRAKVVAMDWCGLHIERTCKKQKKKKWVGQSRNAAVPPSDWLRVCKYMCACVCVYVCVSYEINA